MSLPSEETVRSAAIGEASVSIETAAETDLIARPIEVVFRMLPEEILWVYDNGETFKYSKRQRKAFWLGSFFALITVLSILQIGIKRMTGAPMSESLVYTPLLLIAGYRTYTLWRSWKKNKQSLQHACESAHDVAFRATRNGFSLTDPGVRETAVNWTVVSNVVLRGPFLLIYAAKRVYRIPVRAFPEKELQRLTDFLKESLD